MVRAADSGGLQAGTAVEVLSAHERQRGRKATHRKGQGALSRSKLLGGVPVGGDEPEIGIPQLAANRPGRGMDGGRGGPLGLVGLALGTLGEDGGRSKGLDSGALPAAASPSISDTSAAA